MDEPQAGPALPAAPPEAFPEEPFHAPHVAGPSDHPVVGTIPASHCSGGRHRPEPADLYNGMKIAAPSPDERAVVGTWLREMTKAEILEALCTGVYSARDLQALHSR